MADLESNNLLIKLIYSYSFQFADLANFKINTIALQRTDGTLTLSKSTKEKIIHDVADFSLIVFIYLFRMLQSRSVNVT